MTQEEMAEMERVIGNTTQTLIQGVSVQWEVGSIRSNEEAQKPL